MDADMALPSRESPAGQTVTMAANRDSCNAAWGAWDWVVVPKLFPVQEFAIPDLLSQIIQGKGLKIYVFTKRPPPPTLPQ